LTDVVYYYRFVKTNYTFVEASQREKPPTVQQWYVWGDKVSEARLLSCVFW